MILQVLQKLISINGAFPLVSFIRITRGQHPWVDVRRRTTSVIMSPVDFSILLLPGYHWPIPLFFPLFPPFSPFPHAALPLVSISDSNLMASWYLSHDLPIPISRYRPALDDDGFRLARHHSRHLPKVPRRGPCDSQNGITVWRNSRSKWFQIHQIFRDLVIIVPCVRVSRDCEDCWNF